MRLYRSYKRISDLLRTVYKPGKVCIVLQGRHAGKKVVVIKPLDHGDDARKYPYALIAGVERYPLKVTKRMNEKKLKRRSKVKPFIKVRTKPVRVFVLHHY